MAGTIKYGQEWQTASRQSTGIAPSAAEHKEAIVQVYSARAFNWRGVFGVHTWLATKEKGALEYKVHQVVGWNLYRDLSVVVSEKDLPDRSWYGQTPEIIADVRGAEAEQLIPRVQRAVDSYPHAFEYRVWPGPNSNTFVAFVARQVPELNLQLPSTAIGKDYLPNEKFFDRTPSGTGYQISLFGLAGVSIAKTEGLELNLLGLNFGVDFNQLALILPGIDRVGFNLSPNTRNKIVN
ncbi:MAG: DUF3750 domain-containing protein [Gammaproteobacteria bacterium]